MLGAVVRGFAAAQDHVPVRIALGLQQANLARLVDADEAVRHSGGAHGVDGGTQTAVGAVLNPTGIDRPEAISRWVCDSVVRAPIADQLNKSPGTAGCSDPTLR